VKPLSLRDSAKIKDACQHLEMVRNIISDLYERHFEFAGDKFRRNPDINMLESEIKFTNKLLTVIEKR